MWAGGNETAFASADAMTKNKEAEKAVRLDDNSAEAHALLAIYLCSYEFDWAGAEREFRRAIELNPSYAYAHDQFGIARGQQGRLEDALTESQRAIQLDPVVAGKY